MVFLGKNLSKESFETSHCLQGSVIRVPDTEMDDAVARWLQLGIASLTGGRRRTPGCA
jgi:hypothetical protein